MITNNESKFTRHELDFMNETKKRKQLNLMCSNNMRGLVIMWHTTSTTPLVYSHKDVLIRAVLELYFCSIQHFNKVMKLPYRGVINEQ